MNAAPKVHQIQVILDAPGRGFAGMSKSIHSRRNTMSTTDNDRLLENGWSLATSTSPSVEYGGRSLS